MKKKTEQSSKPHNKYLPRIFFTTGILMAGILIPTLLALFTNFWDFVPKDSAFYSFRLVDWKKVITTIGTATILFLVPDLLVAYTLGLLSSLKVITEQTVTEYGSLASKIFIALWLTFVLAITFNDTQFSTITNFLSIFALLSFLYKKH